MLGKIGFSVRLCWAKLAFQNRLFVGLFYGPLRKGEVSAYVGRNQTLMGLQDGKQAERRRVVRHVLQVP